MKKAILIFLIFVIGHFVSAQEKKSYSELQSIQEKDTLLKATIDLLPYDLNMFIDNNGKFYGFDVTGELKLDDNYTFFNPYDCDSTMWNGGEICLTLYLPCSKDSNPYRPYYMNNVSASNANYFRLRDFIYVSNDFRSLSFSYENIKSIVKNMRLRFDGKACCFRSQSLLIKKNGVLEFTLQSMNLYLEKENIRYVNVYDSNQKILFKVLYKDLAEFF